jgi:hypothetical protein
LPRLSEKNVSCEENRHPSKSLQRRRSHPCLPPCAHR